MWGSNLKDEEVDCDRNDNDGDEEAKESLYDRMVCWLVGYSLDS